MEIKVVDDVLVSSFPQRPNIILNMIVASIIGVVVGAIFVLTKKSKKLNQKSLQFGSQEDVELQDENLEPEIVEDGGWVIKEVEEEAVSHLDK